MSERFHGTTCFEPGVYGYQQHLRSAALDSETEVFTNHPGGTCDSSEMRPGYWYGNGVMPAISQGDGVLLAVYVIPKEHPIHFTHVFWPGVKFDRIEVEENWLFGQKGSGYTALWCSGALKPHDDQLLAVSTGASGLKWHTAASAGGERSLKHWKSSWNMQNL